MAAILTTRDRIARRETTRSSSWSRAPYVTSCALAAVALTAAAATFFVPGVLRGTAVMNGSARGTALVILVVGIPVLVIAMVFAARGSLRARIAWLGIIGYFAYNGVMFVLATPFNQLYLFYEAALGLSIWSAILVIRTVDIDELKRSFSVSFPRRAIALYLLVIATLNGAVWLAGAVPGVLSSTTPKVLAGTGLTTVPTYDQDLAFWIPLMVVSAIWMWRRIEWGRLAVGALMVMGIVESVGVAVDQLMGSSADPASTVASAAMTPVFAALAVTGLVPLFFYMRSLRDHPA
jgi:hypothetical protein